MASSALSARYRTLRKRLSELRRHFLPEVFSPTGQYSDRQLDRARGYRLLAHAEIEAYIEDVARDALRKKLASWKNNRLSSEILVSFLAAYHAGFAIDESEKATRLSARTNPKKHIDELINLAVQQYESRLRDNHGIRDQNLRAVLLPIGVDMSALNSTWLTDMDEFGKQRGEIAHQSIGAQRSIDPRTELQTVDGLATGLAELDRIVVKLSR